MWFDLCGVTKQSTTRRTSLTSRIRNCCEELLTTQRILLHTHTHSPPPLPPPSPHTHTHARLKAHTHRRADRHTSRLTHSLNHSLFPSLSHYLTGVLNSWQQQWTDKLTDQFSGVKLLRMRKTKIVKVFRIYRLLYYINKRICTYVHLMQEKNLKKISANYSFVKISRLRIKRKKNGIVYMNLGWPNTSKNKT